MILIGDKFKFNIGDDICTVTGINPSGYISFKLPGDSGSGFMTFDEFTKRCKVFNDNIVKKPTYKWEEWIDDELIFYGVDESKYSIPIKYRTNRYRVCIKTDWDENEAGVNLKAHSSCHPDDEFDLNAGLNLAKARLHTKIAKKYADELKKEM